MASQAFDFLDQEAKEVDNDSGLSCEEEEGSIGSQSGDSDEEADIAASKTKLERVIEEQKRELADIKKTRLEKKQQLRKDKPKRTLTKKNLVAKFDALHEEKNRKRKRQSVIASDDDQEEEVESDTSVSLLEEANVMASPSSPSRTPAKKRVRFSKKPTQTIEVGHSPSKLFVDLTKSANGVIDCQPFDFYLGQGWSVQTGPVSFTQGGVTGCYEAITIVKGENLEGRNGKWAREKAAEKKGKNEGKEKSESKGEKEKEKETVEDKKQAIEMNFPIRLLDNIVTATSHFVMARKDLAELSNVGELSKYMGRHSEIQGEYMFTDISNCGRELPNGEFKIDDLFYMKNEELEYGKSFYDVLSFTRLPKLSRNKKFTLSMPAVHVGKLHLCLQYINREKKRK